ncbi:hypothetical protein PMO31116_01245 [Pandoraea morbifera]|uniref:Uncharacterized protein n=1 Tax=Pandoraea morbifera TaxID=2508300 RepID=A0A5E4TAY2_9BURK|nr:hypothetical protein PMO31116_01245 [Pandoraea morbifera]
MDDRQATSDLGGRSGTPTTALLAEVRRKGMGVDGWASGVRRTMLGGNAVQTTQAAQAEQLACNVWPADEALWSDGPDAAAS